MFGLYSAEKFGEETPLFGIVISYLYVFIFYFIIAFMYAAVVMRTYDNLRMKKQLVTEAMADILAKEASVNKQVLLNFLFCRIQPIRE